MSEHSSDQKVALLAAGGTGGHLFPAQALAAELRARGWVVHIATDGRAERFSGTFETSNIHVVPSATFTKKPIKMLKAFFNIFRGQIAATKLVKRLKPDVAVGFGGYPSFLPLRAAAIANVPVIIHEANAVMGRANAWLAPRVAAIATGFPLASLSKLDDKTLVTGNPVRPKIIEASKVPYKAAADDEMFKLLVFGGSQGAQFFSDIMLDVVAGMPFEAGMRLKIVQQARPEDLDRVTAFYKENEIDAEVASFFTDMDRHLADAHFVISRAGASTVSELAVIGRPALLVPYPFALDHDQATNAKTIQKVGGVEVVEQADLSADALRKIILDKMNDADGLTKMAEAAKSTANADAAGLLATLCEAISIGLSVAEFKKEK